MTVVEPDALAQAEQISRLPFIFPHIALMPDTHLGKGACVVACLESWSGLAVSREESETNQCHHNYTAMKRHWGKQVIVSRKGAINAEADRPGLIPGSMGTASYVVEGPDNTVALDSAPHGAGRAMSRAAARWIYWNGIGGQPELYISQGRGYL